MALRREVRDATVNGGAPRRSAKSERQGASCAAIERSSGSRGKIRDEAAPFELKRLRSGRTASVRGEPPQFGAGRGAHRAPRRAQAAAAADWLGGFWQHLAAFWGAEGCGADPNGAKCVPATTSGSAMVVQPPAGCGIDPDDCC